MLAGHDLETVEGRVAALRAAAPVVAGIRDRALGVGYIRNLAGWLGMDPAEVEDGRHGRLRAEGRQTGTPPAAGRGGRRRRPAGAPMAITDLPIDPITRIERDALMAMLQHPERSSAAR